MAIDRRDFLKVGLSGLALGSLGPVFHSPFLRRTLLAASAGGSAKKMLVIFMRGGNDGVNTCIPYGDSSYSIVNRPTLFIPEVQAHDLGNGFAALHPALGALHEVHQAGDLATLHRVGYEFQSRSHFDSQHYWENAIPGDNLEEGWLYRHVAESLNPETNPLAAASISDQLMLMFKGQGQVVLPHIPNVSTYNLGSSAEAEKLLGELPNGKDPGSGMLGWYGQPISSVGYDSLIKNTGQGLGASIITLEKSGVDPDTYVPENGATYPNADNPEGFPAPSFTFFRRLQDAAMLLKLTDMQVVGLEVGGFDTHSQQGASNGAQAGLLSMISHGVRSLRLDFLNNIWNDTLVFTMSEFGRTSEENGSFGTDHGEASCMFVAGGSVNGGVYNCDAGTWADGAMFSTPNGRYVAHLSDFRGVFGEALSKHFGLDPGTLDLVLPGFSGHAGDPEFAPLNFLP